MVLVWFCFVPPPPSRALMRELTLELGISRGNSALVVCYRTCFVIYMVEKVDFISGGPSPQPTLPPHFFLFFFLFQGPLPTLFSGGGVVGRLPRLGWSHAMAAARWRGAAMLLLFVALVSQFLPGTAIYCEEDDCYDLLGYEFQLGCHLAPSASMWCWFVLRFWVFCELGRISFRGFWIQIMDWVWFCCMGLGFCCTEGGAEVVSALLFCNHTVCIYIYLYLNKRS